MSATLNSVGREYVFSPIRLGLGLLLPLVLVAQQTVFASELSNGGYVGGLVCATCHQNQYESWSGSHHDLAMMIATEESVLGDFNDASFEWFGVSSTFFRRGEQFFVRTDGPDGGLGDYPIAYTFGVYPLQQYLIRFPGGRLQALDISWDSRPAVEGGQRWFHTHPEDAVRHDDVLHWTGPNMNWNYMCADCHSTNLRKGYDEQTETYTTTWSEIDVSCEACHGPGSVHVSWARAQAAGEKMDTANSGLTTRLDERRSVTWKMDPSTGTAKRSTDKASNREIEVCAHCHSRRAQFTDDYKAGDPFLDAFRPSLLTEGLYHVDGQIEDEVYVWGSFQQSAMYQAGVTCSDCHDPHSADLKAPGDAVCYQCHETGRFSNPDHHFHKQGSDGASCVACHMPPKTYMVIDPRHDHSLRVPRPDLSIALGTPNACNDCHTEQSPQWAAERLEKQFGKARSGRQQYAATFAAARKQLPGAGRRLTTLVTSPDLPEIAKATALSQLAANPDQRMMSAIRAGLTDANPLVRMGALDALDSLGPQERILAFPLLDDEVRTVRIEAARLLAGIPVGDLSETERKRLQSGFVEYVKTQQFNSDRPESQTNLGSFFSRLGDPAKAEGAYRQALKLQPRYIPARVNLAQLLSTTGRESEAAELLRLGLSKQDDSADLHHALGLSLIRQKKGDEALVELAHAARLDPGNPRYSYVYGVALNSQGMTDQAVQVLHAAYERNPGDTDIILALATIYRDAGQPDKALFYARKLDEMIPNHPDIRQLLKQLEQAQN
jgi:predicted CXXCH cytochrome family protein